MTLDILRLAMDLAILLDSQSEAQSFSFLQIWINFFNCLLMFHLIIVFIKWMFTTLKTEQSNQTHLIDVQSWTSSWNEMQWKTNSAIENAFMSNNLAISIWRSVENQAANSRRVSVNVYLLIQCLCSKESFSGNEFSSTRNFVHVVL